MKKRIQKPKANQFVIFLEGMLLIIAIILLFFYYNQFYANHQSYSFTPLSRMSSKIEHSISFAQKSSADASIDFEMQVPLSGYTDLNESANMASFETQETIEMFETVEELTNESINITHKESIDATKIGEDYHSASILASNSNPIGEFEVKSNVNILNLRKSPNTQSEIIKRLSNRSHGTVLSNDGIWAHVKTKNYEGYVAVEYIDIQEFSNFE